MQLATFMQMPGQQAQHVNQLALADPLLKPAMARLVGRIFLRHLDPLRSAAKNPEHAVEHRTRVVPRTATVVLAPPWAQHRLHQLPLFLCQFPTACHRISAETP